MPVSRLQKKAKTLLEGSLKHARGAALAGLLVPLGSVEVEAGNGGPINTSRVDATVTDQSGNGSGPFLYEFEVFNTSDFFPSGSGSALALGRVAGGTGIPLIVDWELPLFAASDIDQSSITSPNDWQVQLVGPDDIVPPNFDPAWTYDSSTDPLAQNGDYGPNPEVFEDPPLELHWLTGDGKSLGSPIFPGDSLGGFSFLSDFAELAAPYLTSWDFLPQNTGDPPIPSRAFSSPLSPARMQAQGIPEPSTLAMVGLGMISLLVGMGWRRPSDSRLATSVIDTSSV